jgi:hypothetical protein
MIRNRRIGTSRDVSAELGMPGRRMPCPEREVVDLSFAS